MAKSSSQDTVSADSVYLFAYGSMKRGFRNHFRLEHCEYMGEAVTADVYSMYPERNYMFPYAMRSGKGMHLKGEVYRLSRRYLDEVIDAYEGVSDGHYIRETCAAIPISGGKSIAAQMYVAGDRIRPEDYDGLFPIAEWLLSHEACGVRMQEYVLSVGPPCKNAGACPSNDNDGRHSP